MTRPHECNNAKDRCLQIGDEKIIGLARRMQSGDENAGIATLGELVTVTVGFDGTAVPMPGISIGYLCQEPTLEGKTVMDNINLGVKKSQDYIDKYTELSTKLSENLDQDETDRVMAELADVENKIDSGNLWELERVKTRAMDALRCPPPNANVDVLSGLFLLLKLLLCYHMQLYNPQLHHQSSLSEVMHRHPITNFTFSRLIGCDIEYYIRWRA